ncbi:MAG: hypothetical protein ACLFUS_14730 [Candidatus Sumerlaeia bacterium]
MNLSNDKRVVRAAMWVQEHPLVWRVIGTLFFAATAVFAAIWVMGKDVEPITFVLSLCSTLFFALPAVAELVTPHKPVSQMSYHELLDFIEASSPKDDWVSISPGETEELFCASETRLRIVHHIGDRGIQNDNFQEPWAQRFPDSHAHGLWYDIEFDRASDAFLLSLSMDSERTLPVQRFQT